jgi:hypothetical protein
VRLMARVVLLLRYVYGPLHDARGLGGTGWNMPWPLGQANLSSRRGRSCSASDCQSSTDCPSATLVRSGEPVNGWSGGRLVFWPGRRTFVSGFVGRQRPMAVAAAGAESRAG